jgi:plasmid stability protein
MKKTTLELPEDLMRAVKLRAVQEDKSLKDMVAELLRAGLAADSRPQQVTRRVKLPLIKTAHPANPEEELTPERIHQILLDQEVDWALNS